MSYDTKKDVKLVVSMVQNAKAVIKGISNSTFNLRTSKILTGFCALMIPVGEADGTEGDLIDAIDHLSGTSAICLVLGVSRNM